MKKSELQTGMILEREGGELFRVLLGTPLGDKYIEVGGCKHGSLSNYNSELKWSGGPITKGDIVRVYSPSYAYGMLDENIDSDGFDIIWERKPSIDIDVTINGKEANLSDLSEETLLNLRNNN